MADSDKISIKSGWFQFLITQIVAFLVYSLGLAYWLGGFSTRVDQHDKQLVVHEQRITDLDKSDTQPGRLNRQILDNHERRLQTMEEAFSTLRPKVEVMAAQIDNIDKKIDKVLEKK